MAIEGIGWDWNCQWITIESLLRDLFDLDLKKKEWEKENVLNKCMYLLIWELQYDVMM